MFFRGLRRGAAAAILAGALTLTPATHAAVRPPRLDYTITALPNGLNVVLLEDHSTPIVHLQIWYHVGSKNEHPGRTGFAHFFEHMMFKGSKNVEPEGHPSYISSVGGQSNAYTTEDATVFWETVPSQYLPLVLWLEADRMASLRIEEKTFKTEREVVKEERRMRVENQPYGRLQEIIADKAFTVHPYKHPVIGSMQDLESASIDDVRDFFRTYYVPNNATAVLVGDFDSKEALAHLSQARLREGHRARRVRRRQHHRGSEPVLRGRDRTAGTHPRRGHERADHRARSPPRRTGQRRGIAAGQEPVCARLHPRTRVGPEQGGGARPRGRDPQRHEDGGRRIRYLPESHAGRCAARRADVFHAR